MENPESESSDEPPDPPDCIYNCSLKEVFKALKEEELHMELMERNGVSSSNLADKLDVNPFDSIFLSQIEELRRKGKALVISGGKEDVYFPMQYEE